MFKMKPKIMKYYSNKRKIITIDISKISLDEKSVFKFLEIFNIENAIVVTDCLKYNNQLFKKIEDLEMKYTTTLPRKSNPYVETILMTTPINKTNSILSEIINSIISDNEAILFIHDKKYSFSWEQYLFNYKSFQGNNKIFKNNICSVYLGFIPRENEVTISFNTEIYNFETIIERVKQIISEK